VPKTAHPGRYPLERFLYRHQLIAPEFHYIIVFCIIGFFLSERLITTGIAGIISREPVIYNFPFGFLRPSMYLFILEILFLPWIGNRLGIGIVLILLAVLLCDLIFEWVRLVYRPSISFGSVTRSALRQAMDAVLPTLGVKFTGEFPNYQVQQDQDTYKIKVSTIGFLRKATLSVSSHRAAHLHHQLIAGLNRYFSQHDSLFDLRGFVVNIGLAVLLFVLSAWRLLQMLAIYSITHGSS